jgi:hypothetical protein
MACKLLILRSRFFHSDRLLVGFSWVRMFYGTGGVILTLCPQPLLLAQEKASSLYQSAELVPFVGCKSDGQIGPMQAPVIPSTSAPVIPVAAQHLAYYESAQRLGVLAPLGWYCFGIYGSGGNTLFISPQPIDTSHIFSTDSWGLSGPAIELSRRFGSTSGRFNVAEIIARVFPAYKALVIGVMELFDQPAGTYKFGPSPKDRLTYKSKTVVEYLTPAQTEGLGTFSWLKKNGTPIYGVAMLIGQGTDVPDALLLSVRLPLNLTGLRSAIIHEVERNAAKQ